ncbi:MAG: N-glycosyltransferase [Verrucomicrobia bacterium ADurb.Bin018]|nr:MAG: N-glycosyltransferase [Verrucomicrobia bacterium ADurb.Bin018]
MTCPTPSLPCTLVTPLRNEMDNIARLWETIQGQTRPPDEWIIADNGSSDGTYEWLSRHAETSPFPVKVLSLRGKTIAQMLNLAITQARHDIIACCHGGTRIPADWLAQLLGPMQENAEVDVSAGVWEPYGETPGERWVARSIYNDCELADENTYCPASRSIAFKRSSWEKAGGFPEWLPKFGEDFLFAVRLHAAGCRFRVAPRAVVGWRPKPALWPLMRQHFYHGQADACLGLTPLLKPARLRPFLPWVGLIAARLAFHHWLPAWLVFCAIPLADHLLLQVLRKRVYHSFLHYLLWEWFVRLAWMAGGLHGLWLLARGHVHRPASDEAAVQFLQAQLQGTTSAFSGRAP